MEISQTMNIGGESTSASGSFQPKSHYDKWKLLNSLQTLTSREIKRSLRNEGRHYVTKDVGVRRREKTGTGRLDYIIGTKESYVDMSACVMSTVVIRNDVPY